MRDLIHKINSPITTIMGFSEFLTRKDIGEKEKDWAKKIHEEALKLKDLVKELSDTISKTPDRLD